MADKRIFELEEAASVDRSAFLAVDDALNGTKKVSVGDVLDAAAEASTNKATGTSFALIGTSEGGALANTIYGMSVQDGTPTPTSPVEIKSAKANFKCVGKNLIPYPYFHTSQTINHVEVVDNGDGSITINGTATASGVVFRYLNNDATIEIPLGRAKYKCLFNKTGTCSNDVHLGDTTLQKTDGTYETINRYDDFVIDNTNGTYIGIRSWGVFFPNGSTADNLRLQPILMLYDVEDTSYEPYKHADLTTDLTLRAIEVTSTDDYNLVKDGKYYVADTVDWSDDKGFVVTRRIKERQLLSSDDWWNGTDTMADIYQVDGQTLLSDASQEMPIANCSFSQCANVFVTASSDAVSKLTNGEFGMKKSLGIYQGLAYFRMSNFTSLEEFKTWLDNNPSYIEYILATPTTESITPEQAAALLSLKTYDEATSIDCTEDVAPVVDLEYGSDRSSALALAGHNEGYIAQELEGLYGVKNLIKYPYYNTSTVLNGLTFTDNGDGTLKVNGTATAITFFNLVYRSENVDLGLSEGDVIRCSIEGCPSSGMLMSVRFRDNNETDISNIDVHNNPINVQVPSGYDHIYIYLYISSGTTLNNVTLKPMLRLAAIQSDEYEPYAMSNQELTEKIVNSGLITEEDFSDSSVNGLYNKSVTNIIAGVENGANASKAYNANDLILRNHNLYEVTVDVASGTAWAVGTNIEVTTLAAQFARINSDLIDLIRRGAMPKLNFANPLHTFSSGNLSYTATKDCYLCGGIFVGSGGTQRTVVIDGTNALTCGGGCSVTIPPILISSGSVVSVNQVVDLLHIYDVIS